MDCNLHVRELMEQAERSLKVFGADGLDEWDKVYYFVISATIIHKILYPSERYGKEEENKNKEKRELALEKYFNNKWDDYEEFRGYKELRKIRDDFEHIDERLDEIYSKCGSVRIERNISIGEPITNKSECQLFNKINGDFYFGNNRINIEKLNNFIKSLLNYIKK